MQRSAINTIPFCEKIKFFKKVKKMRLYSVLLLFKNIDVMTILSLNK